MVLTATANKTYSCRDCGLTGFTWGWDFARKRPVLMSEEHNHKVVHHCERKGIYPAKCKQCNAPDLLWVKHNRVYELTESYGLIHAEHPAELPYISAGRCKYCDTQGLYWIKEGYKFKLVDVDHVKHNCGKITPFIKDWREALRENYAFEKKWVNSKKDDKACGYCKGKGTKYRKHRNPYKVRVKQCRQCKGIGTFLPANKKLYLKALRKKYWPIPGTRLSDWHTRKQAKQTFSYLASKIALRTP